jgi:hypothetical protein
MLGSIRVYGLGDIQGFKSITLQTEGKPLACCCCCLMPLMTHSMTFQETAKHPKTGNRVACQADSPTDFLTPPDWGVRLQVNRITNCAFAHFRTAF